mgnify:FL=1
MTGFVRAAMVPLFRTMRQFAEQEIVLPPSGPLRNQRFKVSNQPWTGLWLDAVDSDKFVTHVLVAMVQGGKTFSGVVIPLMYYLFERCENVGYGIPDMVMARDKWEKDVEPVIRASRYRNLLPDEGAGSKGGEFDSITFKNGATLKFLSAKGGDAKRSGVTVRVVVLTEVDKYDQPGEASRETSPINQMLARLESFAMEDTRIFMECTVSYETGRIWRELKAGTDSCLVLQCPYCNKWGTLEREHLRGWQECEDELEAIEKTHCVCPNCEHPWTNQERNELHQHCKLLHRGQTIDVDGNITGPVPRTLTFAMRVNSLNNIIKPMSDIGAKEWKAKYQRDEEDNNEKALMQFQWARPWNGKTDSIGINEEIVAERLTGLDRYVLPEGTESLVVQIDLHLQWHYWTVLASERNRNPAWELGARDRLGRLIPEFMPPHYSVVDYGISWNPDAKVHGTDGAIYKGLENVVRLLEMRDWVTEHGRVCAIDFGQVDGGYHQKVALEFVTQKGGRWRLSKGTTEQTIKANNYKHPKERTADVFPGDHWMDSRQPPMDESGSKPWWMIMPDKNHWLHQLANGLMSLPWLDDSGVEGALKVRRPSSVALFGKDPEIHLRDVEPDIYRSSYAKQVTALRWGEKKEKGKPAKIGWHAEWSQDHWQDTTYGAMVADSVFRTYSKKFRPKVLQSGRANQEPPLHKTPDGRPYLLTDRK